MKKRKFEDGGPTNDGIVRKRGLRREGTNELVLDSEGMPILTVGEPDKETEAAIAKAKLRSGSDTPSTRGENFLSRLFGRRKKLPANFYEQTQADAESFAARRVKTEDARSRELAREINSLKDRYPKDMPPIVETPLARHFRPERKVEFKDGTIRDLNLKKGGSVTRGDGIAKRGKTKGRYI